MSTNSPQSTTEFPIIYTSQSATSCYQSCNRKRYLNYHYLDGGIVSKQRSVPLTTGSCVHTAVDYFVSTFYASGKEELEDVAGAVAHGLQVYDDLLEDTGFTLVKDSDQKRVIREQRALTEVLIRLWIYKEWPSLKEHYYVLAVEQEIAYAITEGIIYQSKPDLLLIHKKYGDLTCYSLKTIKRIDDWIEQSYGTQNQVFTEPYFTELWLKDLHLQIEEATNALSRLPATGFYGTKLKAMQAFLAKLPNGIPTRVSNIRFCYLIKGQKTENPRGSKQYYTDNPFLYGWRKFSASEIEYNWTDKRVEPNNKSGYGKLGKGWEEFPTFEAEGGKEPIGVETWMHALWTGKIPNILDDGKGDVFSRYILSEPDINVDPRMITMRTQQLFQLEKTIKHNLEMIEMNKVCGDPMPNTFMLDMFFHQNTKSCFYPSQCEYLTICNNGNKWYKDYIAADPLNPEFGAYERRIPHHSTEALALAHTKVEKEVEEDRKRERKEVIESEEIVE